MNLTFDKFDEISHLPLKVFNRVVYLTSLKKDMGEVASEQYLKLFTEAERKQMAFMSMYIKHKGLDAVRKETTKGLVLVEEDNG